MHIVSYPSFLAVSGTFDTWTVSGCQKSPQSSCMPNNHQGGLIPGLFKPKNHTVFILAFHTNVNIAWSCVSLINQILQQESLLYLKSIEHYFYRRRSLRLRHKKLASLSRKKGFCYASKKQKFFHTSALLVQDSSGITISGRVFYSFNQVLGLE